MIESIKESILTLKYTLDLKYQIKKSLKAGRHLLLYPGYIIIVLRFWSMCTCSGTSLILTGKYCEIDYCIGMYCIRPLLMYGVTVNEILMHYADDIV